MLEDLILYHVMKLRYQEFTTKEHSHDYYQLVYVIKGTGEVSIGSKLYPCVPRDIIFIGRNISHYLYGTDMLTFEIKFNTEQKYFVKLLQAAAPVIQDRADRVRNIVHSMDSEIEDKELCMDYFLKAELLKMLITFLRLQDIKGKEKLSLPAAMPFGEQQKELAPAIEYIKGHYRQKVSVGELAALVHMEYKHFSKSFRNCLGVGPKQYMMMVRLEKAKELLLHSDISISQIAEETGFERIHYLDAVFLQYEGMSPREFRENVTNMYKLNLQNGFPELTNPVKEMQLAKLGNN